MVATAQLDLWIIWCSQEGEFKSLLGEAEGDKETEGDKEAEGDTEAEGD